MPESQSTGARAERETEGCPLWTRATSGIRTSEKSGIHGWAETSTASPSVCLPAQGGYLSQTVRSWCRSTQARLKRSTTLFRFPHITCSENSTHQEENPSCHSFRKKKNARTHCTSTSSPPPPPRMNSTMPSELGWGGTSFSALCTASLSSARPSLGAGATKP